MKATNRSDSDFNRFWLTGNEVCVAENDQQWTLCRVWDVVTSTLHEAWLHAAVYRTSVRMDGLLGA